MRDAPRISPAPLGQDVFRRAVTAHQAGQFEAATQLYQQALTLGNDTPLLFNNFGLAFLSLRRLDEAAQMFRRALAKRPKYGDALLNLGKTSEELGQLEQALRFYQRAIDADPRLIPARYNLALLLRRRGDFEGAIRQTHAASQLDPPPSLGSAIHYTWGFALRQLGRHPEAETHFHKAVELDPRNLDARVGVGASLLISDRPRESIVHFESVLTADPGNTEALNALAIALVQAGQPEKARRYSEMVIAAAPQSIPYLSNLLFILCHHPGVTADEFLAAHKRWEHAHRLELKPPRHTNKPDPERPLRVGYVSSDFHDHAAAYYLEPLLASHDRARVETFCFASNTLEDAVTERIRATAGHWIDVRRLDDNALAQEIRAQRIDILVDCSGHTRGSRLPTFLCKPAPIQVGTLLGHAGTTGLRSIDYFLSDPYITPEGFEDQFTEKLICLPRFFAPFLPRESWPMPLPLAPPDRPVFGCVAHPARICDDLLAAWQSILDAVPGAIIVCKHKIFGNSDERAYWQGKFAKLGHRLVLEGLPGGWAANMDFYGRVHIILDSFPLNGATSTLIPLWMGVPVVTWAGKIVSQRCSASAVVCSGLPDLVGESAVEYVNIAATLIRDTQRLERLRLGLRETMQAADFCNPRVLTGQIEAAYRQMWRDWCATQRP